MGRKMVISLMQSSSRIAQIVFAASLFLIAPSVVFAHTDGGEQIQAVTKSLQGNPTDSTLLLRRGRLYLDRQAYSEAIADFDRALESQPEDLSPLMYKGQVLQRLGRYQEALACLDEYIREGSPDFFAFEVRAQVHESLNDPHTAIEDLRRAVELQEGLTAW